MVTQEIRPTKPTSDSEVRFHFRPYCSNSCRYMIIHDSFAYYESVGQSIGFYEAINVTSILGAKGGSTTDSFYHCPTNNDGENIIRYLRISTSCDLVSVTYQPGINAGTMYVAFETGSGDTWRPACCGTYVQLDMQSWWSK